MQNKSQVQTIIDAIAESRFRDAHNIMTSSREPIRLQATLSLIYMAEVGFQLKEIAAALRCILLYLQREPHPTLP
jgi:hypothetical protein